MRLVVVGGGITGLLAAAVGRRAGATVTIVESGPRLGGLLSSEVLAGHDVDYGTHIPQETGRREIDSLLFSGMSAAPWVELPHQRAGSIFGGGVNPDSPFPDVRRLGPTERAGVLADLVDVAFQPPDPANEHVDAAESLRRRYGRAAVDRIFRPVLEHLFDAPLDALEPGAERFFFQRLILADRVASERLKNLEELDERLAFASFEQGVSERRAWYPTSGGAGRWVEDIRTKLLSGVDIATNRAVETVEGGDRVDLMRLDDGTELRPDIVVWTAPVVNLLRAAGLSMPEGVLRPRFRPTSLHHLIVDRPSVWDLHYVTNFDPSVPFFRVTFYDRLTPASRSETTALTVEIFADHEPEEPTRDAERVRSALVEASLLDGRTVVTDYARREIPTGFPVPLRGTAAATLALAEAAAVLSNVRVAGRASGQAFFMGEALQHTWDCVEAAFLA